MPLRTKVKPVALAVPGAIVHSGEGNRDQIILRGMSAGDLLPNLTRPHLK